MIPFLKKKQKRKSIKKVVEFPKVKDVMTPKVVSFDSDDKISYVMERLGKKGVSGAPILKKGKVVGIIHESDIIDWMNEKLKSKSPEEFSKKIEEYGDEKVSSIMSKNPITIKPDESLETAVKKMYKHGVDRLPVVDRDRLVGIVSRDDIIRGLTSSYLAKEAIKRGVKTLIDKIISELRKHPEGMTVSELSEKLGVDADQVKKWASVLEEHGVIEIDYPLTGGEILKIKKE